MAVERAPAKFVPRQGSANVVHPVTASRPAS